MVMMNKTQLSLGSIFRCRWPWIIALLLPLILPGAELPAGVLVSPPVVFLSEQSRTGLVTVQNTADEPTEVSINMSFGLPVSDSLGNIHVTLQDSNVTDPRSCLEWVKVIPRRLIVPPHGTQIVRFVINPPGDIADGEYWARVVVESQGVETEKPNADDEEAVSADLNTVMQTSAMLKYRHGQVFSELELTNSGVSRGEGEVDVRLDMTSKGNASYVGMLNCRLLDAEDREISANSVPLTVYHQLRCVVPLKIAEGDFKTPYRVEAEITGKGREDIAAEDMIYGNDLTFRAVLE